MIENNKPAESGGSSIVLNTAEVTFGETKYTIQRLKAGTFYSALKIYMDMIKEVTPKTPISDKGEATVDFNMALVGMFQTWPDKIIDFIVVCCSMVEGVNREKIKNESFPEQVTEAFRTCLKLNRVAENLKNFAAPMSEIGVKAQDSQKG